MGMQIKDSSGDFTPTSEMNVTPFIDVMLVLLIIFMVVAPISTVNVPVDLPASSQAAKPMPDKAIVVTLKRDLSLFLADKQIAEADLAGELNAAGAKFDSRIFLRADRDIVYGDLIAAFDKFRSAGFLRVSLLATEETQSASSE